MGAAKPKSPEKPKEATKADPGENTDPPEPGEPKKKPARKDPTQTSWIEIKLIDEEGKGVAGEYYEVTLPDDSVAAGCLNNDGFARVDGFEPGTCKISFPDLDKDAWEPA